MLASAGLFAGLVDDAAMFPPGSAAPSDAVLRHAEYRDSWFAPIIGPLVVADDRLAEVGRAWRDHPGEGDLAVSVVSTTGAGGLVSVAGRSIPGIQVVAVESALRDLDDLAGNAARVAAAARELDESVSVFVEIPYAAGWEGAVAEVEAAGLLGKIRTGGLEPAATPGCDQLARQLSELIESDLPFKATAGLHHAAPTPGGDPRHPQAHGFLHLLAAIDALVDGASEPEAATLLAHPATAEIAQQVNGWDETRAARVRRRLRSFGCCGVTDPVQDLAALGLLDQP